VRTEHKKRPAHTGHFLRFHTRLIRFERKQREQTFIALTLPLTFARTWRMLGFQVRAVFLFECDTLCPKLSALSQISHFAIQAHLLCEL